MMKIGQQGTVRSGARATVIEACTNGGVVKLENGTQYTVLAVEFIADDASIAEKRETMAAQKSLFKGIPEDCGFHWAVKRENGVLVEAIMRPLRYAGKPISAIMAGRPSFIDEAIFGPRKSTGIN